MKHFLSTLAIACFLFACKHKPGDNHLIATDAADTTAQTAADSSSSKPDTAAGPFFPVADYIGGQLKLVDSFQLPITKSTTINGKTVLVSLPDAEFRRLAANFQHPDIGDPSLKKFYKESSLADQSAPSVTLSYTTSSPDQEIRNLDVIVQPDPIKSDKVKTIYLEKSFRAGDTIIRQKLYWRANHNFQIITEKQTGKTILPVEQVKVVWDPTE